MAKARHQVPLPPLRALVDEATARAEARRLAERRARGHIVFEIDRRLGRCWRCDRWMVALEQGRRQKSAYMKLHVCLECAALRDMRARERRNAHRRQQRALARANRRCAICGAEIPAQRRQGTRFCSARCVAWRATAETRTGQRIRPPWRSG